MIWFTTCIRTLAASLLVVSTLFLCTACGDGNPFLSIKAPELDGGTAWLNSDKPIKLADLRGKVVLLDFWNMSCVNCFHTVPVLKALQEKFGNKLVVIGIHSPKYSSERDSRLVRAAARNMEIDHPVVNDADDKLWLAYGVKAYPTIVVIDPNGGLVKMIMGERGYNGLEPLISGIVEQFGKGKQLNDHPITFVSDHAAGTDTPLRFPEKVCLSQDKKKLCIADSGHNRIVICDLDGKLIDIIGMGVKGKRDGSYSQAQFNHPRGLVGASDDVLYVADTQNHMIRKIDLCHRSVSTVCGDGLKTRLEHPVGGPFNSTELSSPWDLALVKDDIYAAMAGLHQLWEADLKAKYIREFAGTGTEELHDGPLLSADLAQPTGIVSDGKKLYFVDSESSSIRAINVGGNSVETLVGKGLNVFGDQDGDAKKALLQHPSGIALSPDKLYIADSLNHKIKALDFNAKTVSTIWGGGHPGFADGDYPEFDEPCGLAYANNKLYIADTNNNVLRVGDLAKGTVSTFVIRGLHPVSCP